MRALVQSSANHTWSCGSTVTETNCDLEFFPAGTAMRVYVSELGSKRPSIPVFLSLTQAIPLESTAMSWGAEPDGRENSIATYFAAAPFNKVAGKFLFGWEGPPAPRSRP